MWIRLQLDIDWITIRCCLDCNWGLDYDLMWIEKQLDFNFVTMKSGD
jgi:hypothetical protein